ncbi:hypothetical protein NEMIN01_1435 [Nematocida minor]|uniref:uncharacterized protein n=1 Tax=Nematocida minor TaxID=1912983 RepID=UPI00221FBEA0|nr:uncharacterized protein NEMIN01_1435 [Nematocida minor]KAI5191227.1 hypothetical protein NEMIN01_1435 [Nematocida minor]
MKIFKISTALLAITVLSKHVSCEDVTVNEEKQDKLCLLAGNIKNVELVTKAATDSTKTAKKESNDKGPQKEEQPADLEFTLCLYATMSTDGKTASTGGDKILERFLSKEANYANAKYEIVLSNKSGDSVSKASSNSISLDLLSDDQFSEKRKNVSEISLKLKVSKEEIQKLIANNKNSASADEVATMYALKISNMTVPVLRNGGKDLDEMTTAAHTIYTEMKSISEITNKLSGEEDSAENFLSRHWMAILVVSVVVITGCVVTGFLVSRNNA